MKKILFLLISLSFVSTGAIAKKVKFGTVAPAGTPWAQTLEDIKKRVKKKSKGKLKIKTYLGGSLGGELEILQKIRRGNVQGGGLTSAALASVIPELDVLELPYLFESSQEADYILDNHLFEVYNELFKKKDLILVSWAENGWRNVGHKSKGIKTPADLVGEKMRSQESKVHLAFWQAMGAAPQAISVPETLPALQTGVVKGFDNTPLFTLAAEWHTAIKHFTLTGHIYQPAAIVYSARFWKKTKESDRVILLDRGRALAPESRLAVRALGDELVAVLKDSGISVYKLSDSQKKFFKDILIPLHSKLVTKIGGKAQVIYDIILKAKKEFKNK
jgi:TRAP-type C4-dicarboxylate transport system substrate-binding protein